MRQAGRASVALPCRHARRRYGVPEFFADPGTERIENVAWFQTALPVAVHDRLADRFHETNRIERSNFKPSDLIPRRPRSSRGRLEGWPRARSRLWPSFENLRTRASFDKLRSALLRMRLMDDIDMNRTMKTL